MTWESNVTKYDTDHMNRKGWRVFQLRRENSWFVAHKILLFVLTPKYHPIAHTVTLKDNS